MITVIYRDEAYKIIGICMDVYNNLGYGFLEIVYKDAIEIELIESGTEYEREKPFPVIYKNKEIKRTFYTDFYILDKIIVEIKALADGITDDAMAQTINYLKVSGNKLGLIINFGKSRLEYKRIVF